MNMIEGFGNCEPFRDNLDGRINGQKRDWWSPRCGLKRINLHLINIFSSFAHFPQHWSHLMYQRFFSPTKNTYVNAPELAAETRAPIWPESPTKHEWALLDVFRTIFEGSQYTRRSVEQLHKRQLIELLPSFCLLKWSTALRSTRWPHCYQLEVLDWLVNLINLSR